MPFGAAETAPEATRQRFWASAGVPFRESLGVFPIFPSYGPDHTSLRQEQKRNPRLQFLEVLISGWKKRDSPYPGLVSANPPLEARNDQNGFRSLVPSVNWAQGRRKDSAESGPYRGSQFTVAVRVLVRAQNPDPDGPLGVPWGWIGDDKRFPATTFRFDFGFRNHKERPVPATTTSTTPSIDHVTRYNSNAPSQE